MHAEPKQVTEYTFKLDAIQGWKRVIRADTPEKALEKLGEDVKAMCKQALKEIAEHIIVQQSN